MTKHLVEKNFKCPKPIPDKNGNYINKIKDKACIINSFLNGKKTPNVDNYHCQQLGEQLAIMHLNTQELKISRQNNLSIKYLKTEHHLLLCPQHMPI